MEQGGGNLVFKMLKERLSAAQRAPKGSGVSRYDERKTRWNNCMSVMSCRVSTHSHVATPSLLSSVHWLLSVCVLSADNSVDNVM